jgi:hypothetical protein
VGLNAVRGTTRDRAKRDEGKKQMTVTVTRATRAMPRHAGRKLDAGNAASYSVDASV